MILFAEDETASCNVREISVEIKSYPEADDTTGIVQYLYSNHIIAIVYFK